MSLREYIEARALPLPFGGCWMWMLSRGSHGYGNASTPTARVTTAHRASYEAFKGPIPAGMLVQHSCDNRWCVNPDHLSLGTDATNALDKQIKGRAAKKLKPGDVLAIRRRIADGIPMSRVADEFGVDAALVQRINSGHVWRHIRP
jgi:hypothetical protein